MRMLQGFRVARAQHRPWPVVAVAMATVLGLGCARTPASADQADARASDARASSTTPSTERDPSESPAQTTQPSDTILVRTTPMSQTPPVDLGLSDADYWDNPFKNRVELETELLDAERSAMVIGAPAKLGFQKRESFPLVVMRVDQQDTLARQPFRPMALVVAVELTRNKTYANMAVSEDIVEPPPYDGPPLEGMGGEAWLIDLRTQLDLPWKRGEYLVTVIMRDTISHRVRTTINKGGYEDPAVDEYLQATAGETLELPIAPAPVGEDEGSALPSYRASEDSPELPEATGINLKVPRVVERGPKLRALVRGSFRLPTRPAFVGAPSDGPAETTATVPITLVLTGSDIPAPFVFELQVPSYEAPGGSAEAPEIHGYFNVDLQSLGNLNDIDQTYFIYAFSGEVVTGPAAMALVTR